MNRLAVLCPIARMWLSHVKQILQLKTAPSYTLCRRLFPENEELFIIGGGQIYAEALPLAKRIYLTEVDADYEGDTYFPQWDRSEWNLIEKDTFLRGEKFDKPFAFLTYEKR